MATTSEPLTSAHVDWYLALTRLSSVRRRIEVEGLITPTRQALAETMEELNAALVRIDEERTAWIAAITDPTS